MPHTLVDPQETLAYKVPEIKSTSEDLEFEKTPKPMLTLIEYQKALNTEDTYRTGAERRLQSHIIVQKPEPMTEPKEAFLYKAPDETIREEYREIFELKQPLKTPVNKLIFDKVVSSFVLTGCLPIIGLLHLANLIEGILIPENRGPLFFYYNAVSAGKVFKKYKIRLIKEKYINKELQAIGDWHAFSKEWTPQSRTHVGKFVKKFYLDEIPQLWCVLKGDMSIVGPRPLAVHHYERDLSQGNVTRKLIKGGLLGLGHIMKGTPEMGKPKYEYEYIKSYLHSSSLEMLRLDLMIIRKGICVMIKGKGL